MFLVKQDNCAAINSDCICALYVEDCSIFADPGTECLYKLAKFTTTDEAQAEFNNVLGAMVHSEQYPIYRVGGSKNG